MDERKDARRITSYEHILGYIINVLNISDHPMKLDSCRTVNNIKVM
jgi:hypothetical protein